MNFRLDPSYRLPVIIAVVAHLLLVVVLFISLSQTRHFRWQVDNKSQKINTVKATVVDAELVKQQIDKIHAAENSKKQAEARRLKAAQRKAALAAKKRRQEEQRLRTLKEQQQKLAQKRHQQQLAAKKKALAAKQKLKKQQQLLQDQLLDKQVAEERQRLANEQKQLQARQMQGKIDQYRAQILQVIQSNWHPSKQNPDLYCVLIAHIAAGGVVTSVDIVHSSNDAALDRSAETAVYKSSPLPVPEETALFDAFRNLRIKMSPQDIQ